MKKYELIGLVDLAEHRKLSTIELKTIYNTIIRLLNTNCDIETSENLHRGIFVLENYNQIKEAKKLLLICIHICKLELNNNSYTSSKLDKCLTLIGDFTVTKELRYVWHNIIFLSKKYLQDTNNESSHQSEIMELIKSSISHATFSNSHFYQLLYQYFYKSQDTLSLSKLNKISSILDNEMSMINYVSFVKWVNR